MFRILIVCTFVCCVQLCAQDHEHHHGDHMEKPAVKPPKVFLDKSPRIVEYQLKRLDNERLLLVERDTTDKKYAPVFQAILKRAGMSPQYREEALQALVELNQSNPVSELVAVLEPLSEKDAQDRQTARELGDLLLHLPGQELASQTQTLQELTSADNAMLRPIGFAALLIAGQLREARDLAKEDLQSWLKAIPILPSEEIRNQLRGDVLANLKTDSNPAVLNATLRALGSIESEQANSFARVAPYLQNEQTRQAAVNALLKIPVKLYDSRISQTQAEFLVKLAEETPAADRTLDPFVNTMQLADRFLSRIPIEQARKYRERLREVTVRVVRIHTIEEEMRYDTRFFAVEAGRPVQVILVNEDLMPHNLVITQPGALKEVAQLGLEVGPNNGVDGKGYVPDSDLVLHSTHMVQPDQQYRLTFDAPSEPGEYPYVCTFPRHWPRMYGVMVVVEDLDAWLQDPVEPKDPIGSNREFVQSWKLDDLRGDLDEGLRGRSSEIGARLFTEATCVQCHKVQGQGGAVGPELTEVFTRWKGDRLAVLREILEPSYRIDPKYAVHVIATTEGQVYSGIIVEETSKEVSILDNPEAKEPRVISRSDIDEMVKTSKSMMPKALLDKFSKDEIFEILVYLESVNPTPK